jgi:hypothetical protein
MSKLKTAEPVGFETRSLNRPSFEVGGIVRSKKDNARSRCI